MPRGSVKESSKAAPRASEPREVLVKVNGDRPGVTARVALSAFGLTPHTGLTQEQIDVVKGTVCIQYIQEVWIGSPGEAMASAIDAFVRELERKRK